MAFPFHVDMDVMETTPITIDFTDFELLEETSSQHHKADHKTHTIVDWLERTIPSSSHENPTLTNPLAPQDDAYSPQSWDPDFDRFIEQNQYHNTFDTQIRQDTFGVNHCPTNLRLEIPSDKETPSTTIASSSPQQGTSEGQGLPQIERYVSRKRV